MRSAICTTTYLVVALKFTINEFIIFLMDRTRENRFSKINYIFVVVSIHFRTYTWCPTNGLFQMYTRSKTQFTQSDHIPSKPTATGLGKTHSKIRSTRIVQQKTSICMRIKNTKLSYTDVRDERTFWSYCNLIKWSRVTN